MSKSMATALFLCICALSSLLCASSSSASICSHQSTFFLNTLNSQSPLSYSPSSPLQVGGDLLDRTLSSKGANAYTSVLFYASWCPFSHNVVSTFEVLSSMFPQINHLAVEESSVVPSILLRYGVHSFPTILMVKQTSIMRFHNAKDLPSLIRFYRKTTGWEPVHYVAMEQPVNFGSSRDFVMQSWILKNEGPKSLFKGAGANILRAVASAGVLAGYDKLQLVVLGKKYGSAGGGG